MDFTYEAQSIQNKLETYEWDNVWWEQAPDKSSKRALYIGDSISCGIRSPLNKLLGSVCRVDGFGTSKALDNPWFMSSLSSFGKQSSEKCLVLFNNGLHGWHLGTEEYKKHYDAMIRFLQQEFPKAQPVLISTTGVTDPERNALVEERNRICKELSQQHRLPLLDLYNVAVSLPRFQDGVHFEKEVYHTLAEFLAEEIKALLQ